MWLDALIDMKRASGKTLKEISDESHVPQGTINKLFAGQTSDPQLETIRAVVHCLGFTLNDLDESSEEIRKASILSDEAMDIARQYDLLDKYGRDTIHYLISRERMRLEQIEDAKIEAAQEISDEQPGVIPFRRSVQPASAGTGMYLGPDEFETIYVKDTPLTRRASFGIPVSGDSMEPRYHNGDVLLVDKTKKVRVGEVGVFTTDGKGFVKERGNGELLSLNPKYNPEPMNETTVCNGLVIGILDPDWIVEK